MNRVEVAKELTEYLVKRDQHLALNKEQATQLAHYAMLFLDKHMSPKFSGNHQSSYDMAMGSRCEWDKE